MKLHDKILDDQNYMVHIPADKLIGNPPMTGKICKTVHPTKIVLQNKLCYECNICFPMIRKAT